MAKLPSIITRLFGQAIDRPKAFNPQGVTGTAIYGGLPVNREKSSKWVGQQKYTTSADIAINTSIVAASVHYFLNLVAHPEWTVRPADDESTEAQEVADLIEQSMYDMQTPWPRIVRRAAMYRFYGFSIQEWWAKKGNDGNITYGDVEPRPQFTIERWEVDDSGEVSGVYQRSPQTGQIIGLPRSKLIYLVDDTLTDSPEGLGIFRHLGEPYERLKGFQELEVRAFERDLRGTPIGRAPLSLINRAIDNKEITKEDGLKLVDHLRNFVQTEIKKSDTGILLDSMVFESQAADGLKVSGTPQWGIELLTGPAAGLAELHQVIDRIQREMARIIGTENLMMGDAGGNRALAVDKSRNLYLIANSVLASISSAYEMDYIDPLIDLNGIDPELKPSFEVEDVAFKDVLEVTNALATMAKAGAVLSPDDPAIGDVRDLLGITRAPPPSADMMGVVEPNPTNPEAAAGTEESATATIEAAKAFRATLLKDKSNGHVPPELDAFIDEHVLLRSGDTTTKYNEHHDAQGRFAESDGGGVTSVNLTPTTTRAFTGEQKEIKSGLTRQESGALGEAVIIEHLKQSGLADARPLNLKASNFPVDLIGDHEVIEVKTGLASNGKAAQQWRATIGQPGKAETAWLKTASAEEKAAWNERKAAAIMERKQAVVKQFSQELGKTIKGRTMTVILDHDKRVADVYEFEGFHARIGWKSKQAEEGYVRSYKY